MKKPNRSDSLNGRVGRAAYPKRNRNQGLRKWNACAVGVALALSGTAFAQDDLAEAAAPNEVVTVTGSRIRASGFSTPTPVTAVTTDELELMAPGNLIESMTQLPIFFNNTTQDAPGNFFGTPGSGSLNIRGLNTNRTLTLLNGRRMAPSNRIGAVDINSFPEAVIERVEVVTGGASAAYGTDAVAGVANFILDTDFDGFETHAQTGDSSINRGTWEVGAVFGTEIGDNGHLIASIEAYEQDHVVGWTNQDWYRSWGQVRTGPGSLDTVVPDVFAYVGSQNGVLSASGVTCNPTAPTPGCIAPITFNSNGNPEDFIFGNPIGGGSHSITNGGTGTPNGAERATVSPEAKRESAFFYYDHDLTDNTNVYAQLLYGQNTSRNNNLGGTFTIGNTLTIFSGNAFLPASVQQVFDDNALESMSFTRLGSDADLARGAQQHTRNTNRSATIGIDHDLTADGLLDGWRVSAYVQSGKSEHRGNHIRGIRIDRLPAALDAVDDGNGNIVCNAALLDPANWSDCVPLNLFGAGNASPEAIEWVTGLDAGTVVNTPVFFTDGGFSAGRMLSYVSGENKLTLTEVEQDIVEFSMDGEIADGWAGPILAAFGLHHREEEILQLTFDHTNPTGAFDSRPALFDPAIVRGIPNGMSARTTAIQFASVPNIAGGFEVDEAFAEFIIPLVANKPAVDTLSATLAARWVDYSVTGDIQAWKGGLDWQVNDLLRLRTTVSRDIRAASLAERFDRTGGITNVLDPMFNELRPTSTATGGNPGLNPETADTRTVGLIFQPTSLSGFQASVDWYEIDLKGAVGQLGSQAIVDECWNFPTSSACGLMNRDPIDGRITIVENVFVNINAARASGIDFETAYRAEVGPGSLGWRFIATQLNENSITNLGAPKVNFAGDVGAREFPNLKITTNLTYNQGPFTAFFQLRHIDSGKRDARDIEGVTISDNSVDSVLYTDARVSYSKEMSNGSRWQVFGNITNLFDEDPPVVAGFSGFTLQATQANAFIHDVLGRRYTVGFRYEL